MRIFLVPCGTPGLVLRILMVPLAILVAACGRSRMPDVHGGETHFLSSCDGQCEGDLACLCGVCTRPCEGGDACADLGAGAACLARPASSCEAAAPVASTCDLACERRADCGAEGLACVDGRCRPEALLEVGEDARSPGPGPDFALEPCAAGACTWPGKDSPCEGDACDVPPLVMLVVDTSGSMERTLDCACTTPACTECLPDCDRGERNRWATVLEALTGTFREFACRSEARTVSFGATYDLGYYLPHHRILAGAQEPDGVLDAFVARLRFGLATFDGWDTYLGGNSLIAREDFRAEMSLGEAGMWSYSPQDIVRDAAVRPFDIVPGNFRYPNAPSPYHMDTGIRSADAAEGALRVALDASSAPDTNAAIQEQLRLVRPYAGTPIAAALDDLYYYFHHDPAAAVERAAGREQHIVLLTDGHPDDDYRNFGCDCVQNDDPRAEGFCGNHDPADLFCPYPLAAQAAERLRCGDDPQCADPLVDAVHVVALDVTDPEVQRKHHAIAQAGGTGAALLTRSHTELRAALHGLLREIADR